MTTIHVRPMLAGDLTALLMREVPAATEGVLAAATPVDELIALLGERKAQGVAFCHGPMAIACGGVEPAAGDPETGNAWLVAGVEASRAQPVALGRAIVREFRRLAAPFDTVRAECMVGDTLSSRLLEALGCTPVGAPGKAGKAIGLWQSYVLAPTHRRAA